MRKTPALFPTLLLAVVAVSACATVKDDLATLCSAPAGAPAFADVLPADRPVVMISWAGERMKTEEGRQLISALGQVHPNDRATILRNTAQEEGLATCGFADWLEKAQTEATPATPAGEPVDGAAPVTP
jgi:hypothetical protein